MSDFDIAQNSAIHHFSINSAPLESSNSGSDEKINCVSQSSLFSYSTHSERKRFHAVKDAFSMLGGACRLLISRIQAKTSKFFGFSKKPTGHLVTQNSEQAKETLQSVKKNLPRISDYAPLSEFCGYKYPSEVDPSGAQPRLENVALTLHCNLIALERLPNDELIGTKDLLQSCEKELEKLIDKSLQGPKDVSKAINACFAKALAKTYKKSNPKISKKELHLKIAKFNSERLKARGQNLPKIMQRTFEIKIDKDKSIKLHEQSENIDVSLGAKFLKALDPDLYRVQIDYIESHEDGGFRVSQVRKEPEAQGMLINGRTHSINIEGKEEFESIERSGAFAVHGSGNIGLSKLNRIQQSFKNTDEDSKKAVLSSLADHWHLKGKDRIQQAEDKLSEEIDKRTALTVAQALPKIATSIKKMALDAHSFANAQKTRSFLHVEQSFLSDQNKSELTMIHDMEGAIDYIRENVTVRFCNKEVDENVKVKADGKITMTLYTTIDLDPLEVFGISAAFFTQGVNENQTIGHLISKSRETPQDIINKNGLTILSAYADELDSENNNIRELQTHFSNQTKRKGKDIEGVQIIADTIKALGGRRGIVCKSGKDRTGAECNRELTDSLIKTEDLDAKDKPIILDEIAKGLSYSITGINTGKQNAYAFNAIQRAALPEELKPPKNLCGSVPS